MNILLDEDDDDNYNTSVVDNDNDNAEVSQLFSMVMLTMTILKI